MPDCPHTIGVEFGTRIIEVNGQKVKLQIWDTGIVSKRKYDETENYLLMFLKLPS